MDKSVEFVSSLHIGDRPIIVACSGGPDSMCLLDLLLEQKYRVICAHINHNIRKESKNECSFLKDYCDKKGIPFELLELDPDHQNESYYRRKRYTFYKKLADKYRTPYIATAHHGDDLVETVLMRISRGSHIKGYLGFKKLQKEDKYLFIKPLVYYNKENILEYLKEHTIPYVIDSSNDCDDYTRNRYRHHVLPFLKSETKDVHLKYLKYSKELEDVVSFLDREIDRALKNAFKNKTLDLSKFCSLDPLIQKKTLETIFSRLYKDDVDKMQLFHIEILLGEIQKKKNFKISLPCGVVAHREYDYLTFKKDEKLEPYNIELDHSLLLPTGDKIEICDQSQDTSNDTIRLNREDISLPIYIRTRKPGDKIYTKNMSGSQKVKNIFIDSKVVPSKRATYPIVVDANGVVLWIPGIKKSKFDVNKEGKYDIILKYTQRKENIDEKK